MCVYSLPIFREQGEMYFHILEQLISLIYFHCEYYLKMDINNTQQKNNSDNGAIILVLRGLLVGLFEYPFDGFEPGLFVGFLFYL